MRKKNGRGDVLKRLLGQNIKRFRGNSGYSQLAEIARGLGVYPYDLLKPEKIVSQDIRRITAKLTKDITKLVDNSVKMLNTVAREHD
jgi:transcriptional regulator with XRE-family HTH domain